MENYCFLSLIMQEEGNMLTKPKAGRMETDKIYYLQQVIRLCSKYTDRGATEVKDSARLNETCTIKRINSSKNIRKNTKPHFSWLNPLSNF